MRRLRQALVGWGSPPGPELAHGPMRAVRIWGWAVRLLVSFR